MSFERFDGRVMLLTGVGRAGQVGEAVARELAGLGARLVLVDRDVAGVTERAEEISGGGAVAFGCDLTDKADVDRLSERVRREVSPELDALVNVAGGFAMSGPVADSDPDGLVRQIAINLTTAYLATRAFLPMLRARRGAIVYFASAAVLPGGSVAKMSAYAASKSGVLALMRAVAEEERGNGVRANALAPTAIRTGDNLRDMGEGLRYVEREAVAQAVAFLCSSAAAAINGQVIKLG